MSTIKIFKKNETLYREGEKANFVYLIQSGSVNLHLQRQKQQIDLCVLGTHQIVGEHVLSGAATHPHTAVATSETKVIELPIDGVRAQIESGSQLFKFLSKGFSDKLKVVMKELQSMKLERDNTPCPPDQTAKIFGTVFHVARSKGETKKDGLLSVPFPLMKQYAQRVFLESPKRLEQATNVFVKLGVASYEMGKNEEDPEAVEEIMVVHFKDLPLVEQFFEFYQYYYFKGGKMDLLKTDDRAIQITSALVDLGKTSELDRHGAVRLEYTKVVDKIKETMGVALNNDHFALIEAKGLFVKRQSQDSGIVLQFDFREFERTLNVWRVLREVEKWNEKGFVDPYEPVEVKKALVLGPQCPKCQAGYEGSPKFCSECGHKLALAA